MAAGFFFGAESDTDSSRKMIEGCSLLINTIPGLAETHEAAYMAFPFPPSSCPESKSSCHNYSSSGAEQAPLCRDAATVDVAWPLPSPV